MRRVVITGLGAITPLGVGVKRLWSRLLASHSGIESIKDRSGTWACSIAGTVPQGPAKDGKWTASEWLTLADERRMAKFTQYAVVAAQEAWIDAGWEPRDTEDEESTGVCLGSGIGNFDDIYDTSIRFGQAGYPKVSALFIPRLLMNMAAGHLSIKYNLLGPSHSASTACATGAHALGDAMRFIQHGDAKVMLAGGAESCIHPLAMAGFARLRSLTMSHANSPHLASRPFDRDRDGFVIGEGAGVLVLEELDHALARKAHIYAELKGYGASSDAHHLIAPAADGHGAVLAMRRALRQASLSPSSVDYINAHATSTPLGDKAENAAIKSVMLGPEGKSKPQYINVSSIKGALGHLLGAAGAVEAIASVLAIENGVLPPTLNLDNLAGGEDEFSCNYVPREAQEREVDVVLSNSFGFGGTNASLCFARYRG